MSTGMFWWRCLRRGYRMRSIDFDDVDAMDFGGEVKHESLERPKVTDRTAARRVPSDETELDFQRKVRDGMDSLLKRFMG